jgi:hypothetical protein
MLALLLDNVDGRADTHGFGKLILELFWLFTVLGVIQVNGSLKFLNLWLHLVAEFVERLGGACELINQLFNFSTECFLEVTRDLTSHWDDSFLNLFGIALSLKLILYGQDLI